VPTPLATQGVAIAEPDSPAELPDELVQLEVTAVANGGACVARLDGRVVFVRHSMPGEVVLARITGAGGGGRFWFADAVEILQPAAERVVPPCQFAGPGGCGGCDYQHVSLPEQRRWKSQIVAEQLQRLGGVTVDVPISSLPGAEDGLGWRTRVRYAVNEAGQAGLRQYRSDAVVPVDRCLIAVPQIQAAEYEGEPLLARDWQNSEAVTVVSATDGVQVLPEPGPRPAEVTETAAGRTWAVAGDGFWQVHPAAADALCEQVLAACQDAEVLWDLYCGVGLFAGALAQQRHRPIVAVEGNRRAAAFARRNLADWEQVRVVRRDVRTWVNSPSGPEPDTVVLDPPRKGAGAAVLRPLLAGSVKRLVYIACEPSALGRDTGLLREHGWQLAEVAALDLFPMTHHVETVAVFDR
jgi:tRNA/tmRNA/rRNA uracil-C5-methylase (TrmA/RlmC/RlmD family)